MAFSILISGVFFGPVESRIIKIPIKQIQFKTDEKKKKVGSERDGDDEMTNRNLFTER